MKIKITAIVFFALSSFAISSCKKAGIDGEARIVVFLNQHGTIIPNQSGCLDTVFVKFNTDEQPDDPRHDYDVIFVGKGTDANTNCVGLHTGTYFLFVTGYDAHSGRNVSGGVSVKIKYKDRNKQIDVDVPVTE
jgi:hypothetical protein